MRCNPQKNSGAALVSVLWTIAVLASIAGATTIDSRTDVRLSRNVITNAQVRQVEATGLRLGVASIVQRSRSNVLPGAPLQQDFVIDGYGVSVTVGNEAGRININKASRELIYGLLTQFAFEGRAEEITDAILDWRDNDDERRPAGAEESDYFSGGLSYGPTNADFISVGELRLVLGVNEGLYDELKNHVTVYSGQAGVFPSAADTTVLRAAGGIVKGASAYSSGQSQAISGLRRNLIAVRPGNVYRIETAVTTPDGVKSRSGAVILFEPARRPEPFVILVTHLESSEAKREVKL